MTADLAAEAARRVDDALRDGRDELDLSRLRLTSLPPALTELTDLSELNLSGNWLSEVPDWLGEMTGLTTLQLTGNRLTALPDSLAALTGLTRLDLADNRFATVPEWIGDLTGLTRLHLNDNRFATVPDTLARLTGLTRLNLSRDRLASVPEWLAECSALTELYLDGNRFPGLPDWLGGLTGLSSLGISDCQLTELPEWLAVLRRLTVLHLDNNQLTTLPYWLADLSGLTTLRVGGNRLTTLPENLAGLTGLTELDLYGNRLTALPERLATLPPLSVLRLDDNEFTELPDWLGRLTSLTRLDLDGNRLTALPDSLAGLTGLRQLYLGSNPLNVLPHWIGDFTGLTTLSVASCRLTDLPNSLVRLTELTELDVSGNSLSALPGWLGELIGLTSLRVRSCQLAALPDWLATLTALTELHIDGNSISVLPEWIGDLAGLTALGIGNCHLSEVPDWVANLTELVELNLQGNQLTELPEWLAQHSGLIRLDISSNQLTVLPEWLARLSGLTVFLLDWNRIIELPEWIGQLQGLYFLSAGACELAAVPNSMTKLTGLKMLQLFYNRFTELPDGLDNLTRLTHLVLSNNQLTELPDSIGKLTDLVILYLPGNELTTLPEGLAMLTHLRELYVSRNHLTKVPDWIAGFTGLTRLDLSSNRLTALPDWLTGLPRLSDLRVVGNPLVSPPPEVAAGGSESVMAFLRARQQGSSEQWVSKLLVVGEGGVGKTSLVRALAGLAHNDQEQTTHGIRIGHLALDHPERAGVHMRLSTWDFGGQQIYHATHQFFLTNRSLFLLLWNSRLGWEQGRLRYWLDIITARAPESPIVLVATHTEGRPVDLPLDELRREYPRIVHSVSVDNPTGAGVPPLRDLLASEAVALPLMGSEWPTSWLAAADAVRAEPETHVTPRRMFRTMADAGVGDDTQQSYIATALHELGDILYYAEDDELNQTVVLQPQWANEYISTVLDSHHVAERHGLLSRKHLDELWSDLDRGMREHFLGMMDRYDLSYRIEDNPSGDVSLVVERLQWNAPPLPAEWDELAQRKGHSEIRVIYQLNTMPPGIPTWFIARSHRFSTNTHWRTGALLRHTDGQNLALLHAQPHHKTVELAVRGPSPAAFFSILDDGLNRTLERFPGLNITRQVPCPCQETADKPCGELFKYENLRSRLTRVPPKEEIECHNSGESVSVYRLLLGLTPIGRDPDRDTLEQIKKTLGRMDDKLSEQGEYAQRMFLKLQQLLQIQQETRCPSVFTVVPADRRKLLGSAYELRLYCEEPGFWHPLPDERGRYPITEPAEWLRRFRPYLEHLISVLKHAAPLVGPVLGMTMDTVNTHLAADCAAMKEVISQIPSQLRYKHEGYRDEARGIAADLEPSAHAGTDADFRSLEAMLVKLDPDRGWGGLSRKTTPEGLTLFLCADHLAGYRPAARS